jgi:hypothetical protein
VTVPGRDVTLPSITCERRRHRHALGWLAAGLALLALGVVIGSRFTSSAKPTAIAVEPTPVQHTPERRTPAATTRTPTGAVEAAASSITAFDGSVLLNPMRLAAAVGRIASSASRAQLLEAFQTGSAQTQATLGADTVPKPVIVLRSVPVGYRIDRYSPGAAVVAVWYVGIVGSGATVEPQQSWRTQIVNLVWEHGAWKVSSFDSSAGPTPPLSATDPTESPGELFDAIPRFEEFTRADP